MDKKIRALFAGLIITGLLTACQASSGSFLASTTNSSGFRSGYAQTLSPSDRETRMAQITSGTFPAGGGNGTFLPGNGSFPGGIAATPQPPTSTPPAVETPTVQRTATATVVPSATTNPLISGAIQGAQDYFSFLANQDFSSASKTVSAQSLSISGITAGDVFDALVKQTAAGKTWSDLEVNVTQVFDPRTVLVSVTYLTGSIDPATQETVKTQVNETWAMRLEGGRWLFNWDNIIDTKSLDVEGQAVSGLTVKPLTLIRYTDRISLEMLVQNVSGKNVYFGYSTQTLATFYFGTESVNAVHTQTVFANNQTTLDYTIDVIGLYNNYPDRVELIKYPDQPNYAPMFTFTLSD